VESRVGNATVRRGGAVWDEALVPRIGPNFELMGLVHFESLVVKLDWT
jgi:hypothetical protein